ncbi:hypothetical protein [Sutterella sp.]|uniref:hypothetical protein n=1 Tax=Sutterella sp. TaxID=1981025 RepID=UPI0026E08D96|nr:hypothetical protein [Sutterella sp.]MDO5531976.1 hypothetical protein [Sutterella sp.]
MLPFSKPEEFTIINTDGEIFQAIGRFTGDLLIVEKPNFDIEVDDTILKKSHTGKQIRYTVTEVNYFERGITHIRHPHYQIKFIPEKQIKENSASTNVSIKNSSNIIIGDNNTQVFEQHLLHLIDEINKSNFSEDEKANAKNLLKKLLTNPVVASVVGGLTSAVLSNL